MKITKQQLKQIIKEELTQVLENDPWAAAKFGHRFTSDPDSPAIAAHISKMRFDQIKRQVAKLGNALADIRGGQVRPDEGRQAMERAKSLLSRESLGRVPEETRRLLDVFTSTVVRNEKTGLRDPEQTTARDELQANLNSLEIDK